jgi:integrase
MSRDSFKTVGQVITWWIGRIEQNRTVSASHRKTMGSLVRRHLIPRLGSVKLKQLSRAVVDDKLIWPMQQELSPHTVHKALQGVQQALALAERQRRIDANPLASVSWKDFWTGKLPPRPAGLHPIDVEGLLKTLNAAFEKNPVAGLLPLLMLAHGTRIGETCQLQWRHISLSERVLILPDENTKTGHGLVIPLTEQVCALLDRYRQLQHPARQGSPWVFAMQGGKPLSEERASSLVREISQRQWKSHDLRKLARTVWADIGIDYLVAELMLNHSLGKVPSTYIKSTVDLQRREALERWHAWLDERGFAAAHLLKSGEIAFSEKRVCA